MFHSPSGFFTMVISSDQGAKSKASSVISSRSAAFSKSWTQWTRPATEWYPHVIWVCLWVRKPYGTTYMFGMNHLMVWVPNYDPYHIIPNMCFAVLKHPPEARKRRPIPVLWHIMRCVSKAYIHIHIYIYIYIYIHTHIHRHIHKYIYIHWICLCYKWDVMYI